MPEATTRQDLRAAVIILAIWTAAVSATYWNAWSIDMSALYMAARFFALGELGEFYNAPPDFFGQDLPDRWAAEMAAFGHAEETVTPYVYPPIWAALLSPLAGAVDPMTFFNVTRVPLIATYAGSMFLAWRLMRPQGFRAPYFMLVSILIASLTIPFLFSASLNQPQLLVVFLILLAFERYGAGRDIAAGAVLGLAAAIKLSPVILILIFLADRNWRAPLACVVTALGFAALSLLVAGPALHWEYLARLREVDRLVPLVGFNMSFETLMYNFFVPFVPYEISESSRIGVDVPAVTLAGKIGMVLALAGVLFATRRLEQLVRLRVRLILVYTVSIWFGPIAWLHYYTLPMLLAPGLVGIWPLRQVALVTIFLTVATSEVVMMALFEYSIRTGSSFDFYPQHIAFFPLAALVLALTLWSAQQRRQPFQLQTPIAAE